MEHYIILQNFSLFTVKLYLIWASEYNLGPQKWGVRGPPGSATDPDQDSQLSILGEEDSQLTFESVREF